MLDFFFFFFFQAEDGIRDGHVTGVQTCALPIYLRNAGMMALEAQAVGRDDAVELVQRGRSEERRVGKECRSRRPPYHLKKKNNRDTKLFAKIFYCSNKTKHITDIQ